MYLCLMLTLLAEVALSGLPTLQPTAAIQVLLLHHASNPVDACLRLLSGPLYCADIAGHCLFAIIHCAWMSWNGQTFWPNVCCCCTQKTPCRLGNQTNQQREIKMSNFVSVQSFSAHVSAAKHWHRFTERLVNTPLVSVFPCWLSTCWDTSTHKDSA